MQRLAATPLRKATLVVGLGVTIAAFAAIFLAAAAPAGFGPKLKPKLKSKMAIASRSFTISGSDDPQRFEVYCPRGLRPLGGGVRTDPTPDASGAGAFPVSYERLGQQEGWHISLAQVGRQGSTSVTLQVLCRRYKGNIDPVEEFVKSQTYKNVEAGETERFTSTCPRGKRLISGGYLTSQFFTNKGVYVTESRAVSSRAWTILATGVAGGTGGQVSSIAYCVKARKPLLTEVASAPASAHPQATMFGPNDELITIGAVTATATTPDCPVGRRLVAGGFSAPKTVRVFDGAFLGVGTWTASAAPYTGAGEITALGYCL
ncbi:MAG: hypothetical protein ABR536_05040 [Solirubrobacterales bacterium]